jgi:hydrogenase/urease accessory protein HupE
MRVQMFSPALSRLFTGTLYLVLLFVFALPGARADVVKPALVEIIAERSGHITIEARVSVEALLTGINARYKNTQDAPNAAEYDFYREMPAEELREHFEPFKDRFLENIFLRVGEQKVPLVIDDVDIPPTGYTKVPRISTIYLTGSLPEGADSLQWYYPARFGDNAVRLKQVDKENDQWHWSQWQWLRKDEVSQPFSLSEVVAKPSSLEVIGNYIVIGFEHILPKGLDHILFILGLYLLSTHWRPLLWQVTMFTVAHTITLGLAMNGYIDLPARIVEPLIALSIAYVGFENVMSAKLKRSRLVLVFLFGLLHGLGFASVLSEFGMPEDEFITALISFNIGVEIGQITVICTAFLAAGFWFRNEQKYRQIVVIPGSLLISLIAMYWFFERLELF